MITVFTGMGFSFLLIAGLLFWAPLEPTAMMAAIALGMTLLAAGMGFTCCAGENPCFQTIRRIILPRCELSSSRLW